MSVLRIEKLIEFLKAHFESGIQMFDTPSIMSDEELAEFLVGFKNTFGEEYEGEASCMDWLQSEAKEIATNMENLDVRR